jgi:5-methylcytosine-specific restriction endonuclease McrA
VTREYYLAHREQILAKKKAQYLVDPELARLRAKEWRAAHLDAARDRETAYRLANPEKVAAAKHQCYVNNKEGVKATCEAWRQRNLTKWKATLAEWQKNNPDKVKASRQKFKNANRERLRAEGRAYAKEYAKRNPDILKERNKRQRQENPGRVRAALRRRYGLVTNAPGGHYKQADVQRIYAAQDGLCSNPACGKELGSRFHVDHIVPLFHGGSNGAENIQIMCPGCNVRKATKTMEEFVASQQCR